MRGRAPGARAALLALILAVPFAGCGDEETTTTSAPTTTSSSTTTTSSITTSSSSTAAETTTTVPLTSTTSTVTESTGAETTTLPPDFDPEKPDSEDNDKPPQPGSPEEAFEQACEDDPSLCG